MGLLNRIFGAREGTGAASPGNLTDAVATLAGMYDDPEVKSERGLSVTGPRANEVRAASTLSPTEICSGRVPRRKSPPIRARPMLPPPKNASCML